ncbi:MAG: hypothetical protein FWD19_05750, partial [Defluviitaleaceae bacterium]|nr:hypothetical protein [Defluviitaleaceae bacterium]
TVTYAEEQQFVEELIAHGSKYQYWLGATDEEQEGTWRWVTGENWNYTNWGRGQPNNSYGLEHYLQIHHNTPRRIKGDWNDISANNSINSSDRDIFQPSFVGLIVEWS